MVDGQEELLALLQLGLQLFTIRGAQLRGSCWKKQYSDIDNIQLAAILLLHHAQGGKESPKKETQLMLANS